MREGGFIEGLQTYQSKGLQFYAGGPKSLEDYFQKGALLGQKEALNL